MQFVLALCPAFCIAPLLTRLSIGKVGVHHSQPACHWLHVRPPSCLQTQYNATRATESIAAVGTAGSNTTAAAEGQVLTLRRLASEFEHHLAGELVTLSASAVWSCSWLSAAVPGCWRR